MKTRLLGCKLSVNPYLEALGNLSADSRSGIASWGCYNRFHGNTDMKSGFPQKELIVTMAILLVHTLFVALFPGHSHHQYLITCSMQMRWGEGLGDLVTYRAIRYTDGGRCRTKNLVHVLPVQRLDVRALTTQCWVQIDAKIGIIMDGLVCPYLPAWPL